MLKNAKKCVFNTTDEDFLKYNGEEVEIIRPIAKTECDIGYVGNMYKIRFSDGSESTAFEDELEE